MNTVTALYAKLRRLSERKQSVTSDYKNEILQLDMELEQVKSAIKKVESAVSGILCPSCNGTGERRFTDAAGGIDVDQCSTCKGTGIWGGDS